MIQKQACIASCIIFSLVFLCHCKQEQSIRIEGYDSLRASNDCTVYLPTICSVKLLDTLHSDETSYNALKQLWVSLDTNRKDLPYPYNYKYLDGKYGWYHPEYVTSLCSFIKENEHSFAALTGLLELYLIYSYQEGTYIAPHEMITCDGHSNKYYKNVERFQHDLLYHYPHTWQSLYIETYLERKRIIAAYIKRYKDIRIRDEFLTKIRTFDENPPQEFLEFRKHVIAGITSTKNINPKLGAYLYKFYVTHLKRLNTALYEHPLYTQYYEEYWKYYPEFIATKNHGLPILY